MAIAVDVAIDVNIDVVRRGQLGLGCGSAEANREAKSGEGSEVLCCGLDSIRGLTKASPAWYGLYEGFSALQYEL